MARIRREPKNPLTPGAVALRAFLDRKGISVPQFCEEHGIDRITCQRAMNGDRKRISVDFAAAVARATRGAVKVELWAAAPAPAEGVA